VTVTERPYLSIGEVLALLLEEFPDVTISKIRFLESQGLIDPERTPSGYRKFYDGDVERLRVILREQRENFLPLRVIRDRLESGEIDDSGSITPPRGLRNVPFNPADPDATGEQILPPGTVVPTGHHPAGQLRVATSPPVVAATAAPVAATIAAAPAPVSSASAAASNGQAGSNAAAQFFAPVAAVPALDVVPDTFVAAELCSLAGLTQKQLSELESYGLVNGKGAGTTALYSTSDLHIAKAAAGFLAKGVEVRHLRGWKQSAEREASLFEQLVLPLLRQRNPQSRAQAGETLQELSEMGAALRAALLTAALRQHLEG
jgi:DNA-binding transcriptional MerR regulator